MKKEKIRAIKKVDLPLFEELSPAHVLAHRWSFEHGIDREKAESDEEYLQIVAYAAVIDKSGRIFIYKRKGQEKRLEGKLSIGVGGHIRADEHVVDGLYRELYEEIGITDKEIEKIKYLGTYYNPTDKQVDRVHLGLMFKVTLKTNILEISSPDLEGKFTDTITSDQYEKLELWSKALLDMLTKGEKDESNS